MPSCQTFLLLEAVAFWTWMQLKSCPAGMSEQSGGSCRTVCLTLGQAIFPLVCIPFTADWLSQEFVILMAWRLQTCGAIHIDGCYL